tara:strand:+ start:807 stop:1724 length:918 start_codon:yes stop_codon:yes gene_type:complete
MFLNIEAEQSSIDIVNICINPKIDYPYDKFSYSVGSEPIIYTTLIHKCTNILGLRNLDIEQHEETKKDIKRALQTTNLWLNEGYLIMKGTGKESVKPANEMPFSYFLSAFEAKRNGDPENAINIHPAYFLLAILSLSDYRKHHLSSYSKESDFDGKKICPTPLKRSIDALGSLLNAQISAELGGISLEKANGNIKVSNVNNELHTLEKRQKNNQKGITEINDTRALLKTLAEKMAVTEWAEDTKNIIRIGKMAEHIITRLPDTIENNANFSPEQKILLKKHLPKITSMKKWIRPKAPDYAQKRGR